MSNSRNLVHAIGVYLGEARSGGMRLRIREVREAKYMTQFELAVKAGLTPTAISRLESKTPPKPRPSTLRKLASALGVEPDDLIIRE